MKIAIVGSREFPFPEMILAYLKSMTAETNNIILSGGASGVDTFAVKEAERLGFKTEVIPAQWISPDGTVDKLAGFKRNIILVDASDLVIAFWDLMSRGTAHTIAYAYTKGKLGGVYTV